MTVTLASEGLQVLLAGDHGADRNDGAIGDLQAVFAGGTRYYGSIADLNVISYLYPEDHGALSDHALVAHLQGAMEHAVVADLNRTQGEGRVSLRPRGGPP